MTGFWSIIVPEATKNYLPNPSLEVGTTGYTNHATGTASGTRARSATWQRRGVYSYALAKTGGGATDEYGAYASASTPSAFVSGDYATFSVDLYLPTGTTATIEIEVTDAGGAASETLEVTGPAEGRYSVTSAELDATATAVKGYVYVTSATGTVYTDGWQIERKAYATTYCDGDQGGCTWSATAHGSVSTRSAQFRAGGRRYNLDDYGLYVRDPSGIGMPGIRHVSQMQAQIDGALWRDVQIDPRTLVLEATINASSRSDLHSKRSALINAVKGDLVSGAEPLILEYTGANSAIPLRILARYDSGLEWGPVGGYTEDVSIRFVCYDPLFYTDGNAGASLTEQDAVASVNYIIRKVDGEWQTMGTGGNGNVLVIKHGPDGNIYVGGQFSAMNSVSNTGLIAKWDPEDEAWSAIGTGGTGAYAVECIAFDPAGNLYVGGNFLNMGGVAACDYLAKWDGSNWSSITASGAANGRVKALAFGPDGTLYAAGEFTSINGVAANYVAQYDGSTWSALGTGLSSGGTTFGSALAVDLPGNVYVGGQFTGANGVTVSAIAKWNGTTFEDMGGGAGTGNVSYIEIAPDGTIYAGGTFANMGGVADADCIARWTGTAWEALGTGITKASSPTVYRIQALTDGLVYVAGNFDTAGGLSADYLAVWNGSSWALVDIVPPGQSIGLLVLNRDHMYIGGAFTGTAYASKQNTVTNSGSFATRPAITFAVTGGTAELRMIRNVTSDTSLWFDHTLLDGEKLTIDLTPGARSCVSSYFGPLWKAVLSNSDVGSFRLLPGENEIEVSVVDGSGSPTITVTMTWPEMYWSVDGVA